MYKKISSKRLKELLETEKIMRALEGAGVDNWEGYEIALEPLQRGFDIVELIDTTSEEILYTLSQMIDEPAGRGAGYGWQDDAEESLTQLLEVFLDKYKKL